MRTFLVSNLLKNGVSWRGFKGSIIFALGFYTNHALTPNFKTILEETKESLDEATSLSKECKDRIAKFEESRKIMNHLMQSYRARMDELEEVKKAEGQYTVETCCESQSEAESVWSSSIK